MLSEEDLDDLLSDLFGDGAEEVDCDEFVSSMLERIDRKESIPILSDTTRYWQLLNLREILKNVAPIHNVCINCVYNL